jgi:hypothetical protein
MSTYTCANFMVSLSKVKLAMPYDIFVLHAQLTLNWKGEIPVS